MRHQQPTELAPPGIGLASPGMDGIRPIDPALAGHPGTAQPRIDRARFTDLLRTSDPAMRRLAGRLMGSPSAMDDALQDAYVKAYRKLDTFSGTDDAFGGWLYRIVYNTCLDHLRSLKRRRNDVEITTHEHMVPDLRIAVGDQVVQRSHLVDALHALPADQATALTLIDGEGYSYDEAAAILDVPRGTVASRVNRARIEIRRMFTIDTEEVPR